MHWDGVYRRNAKVQQWFVDNQDKITRHVYLMPADTATTVRLEAACPVVEIRLIAA